MKSVKSIRIIIAEVLILSTCVCIYYLVALDKPSVVNVVPERSAFEGRMPGNDEMPKNNFLPEQFKNEVEQSIDLSSLPFKPLVAPISALKIQPVIRTIEAGAGEKITTGKFSIHTMIPVKDMSRFRYSPDGDNIFWAVLNNDVVAVVTPQEFKQHPLWPGTATFKVELFDNLEQTKAFLKKEFESINRLPA